MAGITDLPYRLLLRSFGCELAFLEMVSSQSLVHESERTRRMLSSSAEDRPLGAQLLGNEEDAVLKALENIRHCCFDMIDLNAACPVPKITKKGKGASLLKEPTKVRSLLEVLVKNADVPVTVKIRAGWDRNMVNARDVALHAEDAGISALTIHGRTREQGYSGRVDYAVIKEVKEALSIPVIASGDALSPQLIRKMFSETGCDAVAVARGSLGNPWIFRDTISFLETGTIPERPSPEEIADTMRRHLDLTCTFYGDKRGTILFRKLFSWYVKGLHEIRSLKEDAFRAQTREQMIRLIENIRDFAYRHPEGIYEGFVLSC
jgi:nifR3 family TIM-barrel protein